MDEKEQLKPETNLWRDVQRKTASSVWSKKLSNYLAKPLKRADTGVVGTGFKIYFGGKKIALQNFCEEENQWNGLCDLGICRVCFGMRKRMETQIFMPNPNADLGDVVVEIDMTILIKIF